MSETTAHPADTGRKVVESAGVAIPRGGRPTNFVAAALPDLASSQLAIAELVGAGVGEETIAVLQGGAGAAVIAAGRRAGTWFDLSDEDGYVARFEEEARSGHFVLGVPVTRNAELRSRVRSILARHGGHAIVSRSRWTHEVAD